MASMDATFILQLWEDHRSRMPLDRSLAISAVAEPQVDAATAAAMPIGERNARLLRLRQLWSQADFEVTAVCPHCAAMLEFAVAPEQLLESAELAAISPLEVGRRVIHWRPISSHDLAAAAEHGDPGAAATVLLERCVQEIVEDGVPVADADTSQAERAALAAALEAVDPLCDVVFDLACAECGHRVHAELDIPQTVWQELDHQARRVVSDVHALASAYGWTESECLALSPARRSIYLEWVGA